MKSRRVFLGALAALVAGCAQAQVNSGLRIEPLEVRTAGETTHRFEVEIADTPESRSTGLMNRDSLAPGRGMLFQFDWTARQSFWMKNTRIPLDIIFIRPDGRIDSIAENTKPFSLDSVPSAGPVNGVLEIAGGHARQLGIRPGDRVIHPFFRKWRVACANQPDAAVTVAQRVSPRASGRAGER